MVSVLQACAEPILRELAPVPDAGFADMLSIGLDVAARGLMPRVGPALAGAAASSGVLRAEPGLLNSGADGVLAGVVGLTASLGEGSGCGKGRHPDRAVPARFAPQFQAAMAAGLAELPGWLRRVARRRWQ